MSNQPEQEHPQPETLTPQELRESILTDLEATRQAIVALNDEELETVAGGYVHPSFERVERARRALHEIFTGRPNRLDISAPSTPQNRAQNSVPPSSLHRTKSTGSMSDHQGQMERLEQLLN